MHAHAGQECRRRQQERRGAVQGDVVAALEGSWATPSISPGPSCSRRSLGTQEFSSATLPCQIACLVPVY